MVTYLLGSNKLLHHYVKYSINTLFCLASINLASASTICPHLTSLKGKFVLVRFLPHDAYINAAYAVMW